MSTKHNRAVLCPHQHSMQFLERCLRSPLRQVLERHRGGGLDSIGHDSLPAPPSVSLAWPLRSSTCVFCEWFVVRVVPRGHDQAASKPKEKDGHCPQGHSQSNRTPSRNRMFAKRPDQATAFAELR